MRVRRRMACGDVPVGAGIVDGPVGGALRPIVAVMEAPAVPGVHQAGEDELGLLLPVGGQRHVLVFDAGELAERALESEQRAEQEQGGEGSTAARRINASSHR